MYLLQQVPQSCLYFLLRIFSEFYFENKSVKTKKQVIEEEKSCKESKVQKEENSSKSPKTSGLKHNLGRNIALF